MRYYDTMNKYNCDYYEVELEEVTHFGSQFKEHAIVSEMCNYPDKPFLGCQPDKCTFHSNLERKRICPACQHGFYAQRQQRWMCEYPNEEEEHCKAGRRNYYKDRWSTLEPEFTPEFITEEEMKI